MAKKFIQKAIQNPVSLTAAKSKDMTVGQFCLNKVRPKGKSK